MNFPPQIYLIGAQKAGTTSLASYLASHPAVCVSEPKESHYFTNNWSRGEAWYKACFAHAKIDDVLVDASTSYTMARLGEDALVEIDNPYYDLVNRIRSLSGSPKFIYLLRDPVKRTYSAYWHRVRAGEENRSFQDAVINKLDENNFYIRPSLYVEQLKIFLEFIQLDDIYLPLFENFIKDPLQTMDRVYSFIGVEAIELQSSHAKNTSYSYSGVGRLLQLDWISRVAKLIGPYIPEAVKSVGKRTMTKPIPTISKAHQEILQHYFKPYNDALVELASTDISIWDYQE